MAEPDLEQAAFAELAADLYARLEAAKVMFSTCASLTAIEAMQRMLIALCAAVKASERQR